MTEGAPTPQPKQPLEIEKKWLVDLSQLPFDLSTLPFQQLEQRYAIDPRTRGHKSKVTRLRSGEDAEGRIVMTTKIKKKTESGTKVSIEANTPIQHSFRRAEILWNSDYARATAVAKRRYEVPIEDGLAQIDVFEGPLAGLANLEVEFKSESDAASFRPPPWFGRDVTEDDRYSNFQLAVNGLPKGPDKP